MNKQMKPSLALFIINIRDAKIQGLGFVQLFHLFHKYLLNICFAPSSSLSAGDAAMSTTWGLPSRCYGIVEERVRGLVLCLQWRDKRILRRDYLNSVVTGERSKKRASQAKAQHMQRP